jgi:hypothetical protein
MARPYGTVLMLSRASHAAPSSQHPLNRVKEFNFAGGEGDPMKSYLRFAIYLVVLYLLSVIFGSLDAAPREPKDEILLEHVRTEAELARILDDSRGPDGVLRLDRIPPVASAA